MSGNRLLHFTETGNGSPLIILHGLFGSGKNWQSLSKEFAEYFKVYTIDLRNHGLSFHDPEMDYENMAEDVYTLLKSLDISACRVLGHSMGGKTAMVLAHNHPQIVTHTLIADIAPVAYQHEYHHLLDPLLAIQLDRVNNRSHVDQILQSSIPESQLRYFLLQNLKRVDGLWQWNTNLSAIKTHIRLITGFPKLTGEWRIDNPTCFIRGGNSDYIGASESATIHRHFSNVSIQTITGAGHWLHVEQPVKFIQKALQFLKQ